MFQKVTKTAPISTAVIRMCVYFAPTIRINTTTFAQKAFMWWCFRVAVQDECKWWWKFWHPDSSAKHLRCLQHIMAGLFSPLTYLQMFETPHMPCTHDMLRCNHWRERNSMQQASGRQHCSDGIKVVVAKLHQLSAQTPRICMFSLQVIEHIRQRRAFLYFIAR